MRTRTLALLMLLVICVGGNVSFAEDQPAPTQQKGYLENLLDNGVPAGIGELIGAAQESGTANFTNEAWKGGQIAKDLAVSKFYRDKIAELAQWFGILQGLADTGMKIYYEQYDDALISGATTGISIFSATSGGAAYMKALGITGPMVTAAVLGAQIYIESHRQLAQERIASELQQVYGTMERMTRDRNRTTGEGDPFPVTPENIEKIWQRILTDQTFRNLFRSYVTNQLNRDFPDLGLFERQSRPVPAMYFGGGLTPIPPPDSDFWSTDESEKKRAEALMQEKLQAEEQLIKTYIAGLVAILNKAEKKRERAVVLRQAAQLVLNRLEMGKNSNTNVLVKVEAAIMDMWQATAKAKSCSADIAKAAEEDDYPALRGHVLTITNLVKDVLAWIPDVEPFAQEKKESFAALNSCYEQIVNAVDDMRVRLRVEAEKRPKDADGKEVEISQQAPTPEAFYQNHFSELIKPFDWQGHQDPEAIKILFVGYLETGNFRSQLDSLREPLPPGREPLAELLTEAWRQQNYDIAFGGVRAGMQITPPDPKNTIEGHYQEMMDQILSKKLADLEPEVRMLETERAQINEEYQEKIDALNNRLASGTLTHSERNQVLSERSSLEKARRDLTSPLFWRIYAFQQNYQVAMRMVRNRIDLEKNLALDTHQEILIWMQGARGPYEARAREMFDMAQLMRSEFHLISRSLIPEQGMPSAALDAMDQLLNAQAAYPPVSYRDIGIGKITAQSTDLKTALEYNVERRKEQLDNAASTLFQRGTRILSSYEEQLDGYRGAVEGWKQALTTWQGEFDNVRIFLGQQFLNDEEFKSWQARYERSESYISRMAGSVDGAHTILERRVNEIYADAFWLKSVLLNFQDFVEAGTQYHVFEYRPGSVKGLTIPTASGTQPVVVSEPYRRYLTTNEKNRGLFILRQIYTSTNLSAFGKDVAPWFGEGIEALLREIEGLRTYPEENFFPMHPTEANAWLGDAVGRSALIEAERLVAALQPGTPEFADKLREARNKASLGIYVGSDNKVYGSEYLAPSESPLAAAYRALQAKVRELIARHIPLEEQRRQLEQEKQVNQAITQLQEMMTILRQRVSEGNSLIAEVKRLAQANSISLDKGLAELDKFHNQILDEPYHPFVAALNLLQTARPGHALLSSGAAVTQSISQLNSALYEAKEFLRQLLSQPVDQTAEVLRFYDQFKQAYERKNDSRLMSFLDDRWSAGDGTTLYDVEDYFRNMFRVFDEIRLDMRGLRIDPIGDGRYRASYDLTIIGRIYSHNLEHEEQSSVVEEIGADSSGRMKIMRTPQGRFWHQ